MSTQQETHGASGIKLQRTRLQKVNNEFENAEDVHYLFYGGDAPIPLIEYNLGIQAIYPFSITSVDNHSYWDRDQSDEVTPGLRRRPREPEQVYRIKTAGSIVNHLLRDYGSSGLVLLKGCTGMEAVRVIKIGRTLLPDIKGTYDDIKARIEDNIKKAPTSEQALYQEVQEQMLLALEIGSTSILEVVENLKSEMESRAVPNGIGRAKLDFKAKKAIKLLGKSESDYVTDAKAAGQAAALQVGMALKAMGGIPQQQATSALLTEEQMMQQARILAMAIKMANEPTPEQKVS